MKLEENHSLKGLNSLALDVRARYFRAVNDADDLLGVLKLARDLDMPAFALGEGTNVVFSGDFPGCVIRMDLKGVHYDTDKEEALVTAGAGENWHALVVDTLARKWYGLENLALIPGSVGAAPVQNIGAYGVELQESLERVTAIDTRELVGREFSKAECGLGYRTSVFKEHPGRYIITAVTVRLARTSRLEHSYDSLAEQLTNMPGPLTADKISRAVVCVRRRRLPDPAQYGNVGSFFKNPIVDGAVLDLVRRRKADARATPVGNGWKLSAAELIDAAGLKGRRVGGACVSRQHPLVLVNVGHATPEDVLGLADEIRTEVHGEFGVTLETEPTIC